MNQKLIEQRLKRVITELADEFSGTFPTPDDILYIFNENELFVVDIESYDNPKPRNSPMSDKANAGLSNSRLQVSVNPANQDHWTYRRFFDEE